ncbi:MAG: hypothetical protein GY940_12585, partial [bacterium]|nr:hypothetical protein [bacterium]
MKNSKTGRFILHCFLTMFLIIPGFQLMGQSPPTATTDAASGIGLYQADLNGTVNANGVSTSVTFEYGLNTGYGFTFPADPDTVTGTTDTAVSATIFELSPNTTYHYRVLAENADGTTYGADMTFTTDPLPPDAVTTAATNVAATTATLNGSVQSRGFDTTVSFEYGTDTSYGTTVTTNINPFNPVLSNWTSPVAMSTDITGLVSGTTYHYRIVATNSVGTAYGDDVTFTFTPTPPTAVTEAATFVGSENATLNGRVNPNGLSTTITFEYGLDTSYGESVAAGESPLTGTIDTPVSSAPNDLDLLPNTTYNFRIVATNAGGTTYGTNLTFTTLPQPPEASTGSATAVTISGATLNGTVNANDDDTAVTFEYGIDTGYGSTAAADQSPVSGSTDTAVNTAITGLANNVTYHFRVVATNGGGTTYGDDMTFTTGAAAPDATTNAATGIGTTFATLNGTVNANNDSTTVTFEYGTTTSYGRTATADQDPVTGSSDTAVSVTPSDLIPATLYHFRVVAVNSTGTSYGADLTFFTPSLPTVSTDDATSVSSGGATLNGTVNANDDSTTVTFEYGTTTAYGTTVSATPGTATGNSDTGVSAVLSGLTANTTYHYRVVGQNSNGTGNGDDKMFFTSDPAAPTVSTDAASGVISTGATLNGTVNANNADATVTFEYGTTTAYGTTVTADESPVSGGFDTAVSVVLTGLSNNTTYHYRVVAVNAQGTTNGADMTFSTGNAPSAITEAATMVGATFATLNGTANGNVTNANVSFQYGLTTSYGSSVTGDPSFAGTTDTAITANITGLAPNTTYHYRLVAQGFGTTNGEDMTFTTSVGPSATTNAATSIGTTTATLNGTVNANGESTTVTFQYGLTDSYGKTATAGQSPVSGSSNTAVSANLTDLIPNTTYHFRVVAENVNDAADGSDLTFTTGGLAPSATTNSATGVNAGGATLNGTVNARSDSTTVTFEYGTDTSYGSTVTADQSPVTGSSNNAVSAVLTGLAGNTTYHYRVVATNGSGTTYGADETFFTAVAVAPTATTDAATNVTDSGATINGTVNANGNVTTVTFEFGPSTSYGRVFNASPGTVSGTSDTAVSFDLSSLPVGATFHYRVVASSSAGTTYGADMTFTTTAPIPTAVTGAATSVGTTTATLNGTVNANGVNTAVTFEYGTTTSYGSTITADQSPLTGSSDTAVTVNLIGLTPNTTYHYRVVAQNEHGTAEGSDMTFTTDPVLPTAVTQPASGVGAASATLNGTVNASNDSTTVTFQYGTTTSYGSTVTAIQSPVTGSSDTAVSANISGLAPNTTYHFRVVAQNSGGTVDGADLTFTTSAVAATVTTTAATGISDTGATLNGLVNANNDSTTVTFEYGTDTSYGNVVTAVQSPVTGSSDTAVSAVISGLTPDTEYHFRVVGVNSSGTANGADLTFTTDPPPTPTVTTKPVTNIGTTSAQSGGDVTDEGSSVVTARGVVWSTSPNPTLADNVTTDGAGPGSFVSTMTPLTEGTTYYVRAYATNSFGTAYGEEFEFTTNSAHVFVTIKKPDNGDVVSGSVRIKAVAHATGPTNIDRVEFFIDSNMISSDTKPPFQVYWNSTTGYPDGNYAIRAIAYDDEGHSSEDSITVTLSNGAAPVSSETITTNRSHLDFKARKIRTFFGKKVVLVALPKLLLINTNGNHNLNWSVSTGDTWLATFPKRGKGSKII